MYDKNMFEDCKESKVFAINLMSLIYGDPISEENWTKDNLINVRELRNEWASCFQSLEIMRTFGFAGKISKTEGEEIDRLSKDDPIRALIFKHIVELREMGFDIDEWWSMNHYFYDVIDFLESNWALRNI